MLGTKADTHSPSLLEAESDMVDSLSTPHAAEYVLAQQALAQDCATLRRIDQDMEACRKRIAHAYAQIRLLERQRGSVERCASVHRARLSPLRVVPDQMLQEIFQRCLPDVDYIVPDALSAPLVLTHVCRRWRIVAQGTSELWSSIALLDRGVWNYELEVTMVRQWLDRTRMRPICMSITCPPCTDFGRDARALRSDIFQLAIAHSAQLRDVCLNVNKTYLTHFFNLADLAGLGSIVIALHSTRRVDEPAEPTAPALSSAPNLGSIAFKGDGPSIEFVPRTIYPQITRLSFDCNTVLDLALLFHDFCNLAHLTLVLSLARDAFRVQLPPPSPPSPDGRRTIVGPSLRHFEICIDKSMLEFGDPTDELELLDHLELPALQTLSIIPFATDRRRRAETGVVDHNHVRWVRSRSVVTLLSRSRSARLATSGLSTAVGS